MRFRTPEISVDAAPVVPAAFVSGEAAKSSQLVLDDIDSRA